MSLAKQRNCFRLMIVNKKDKASVFLVGREKRILQTIHNTFKSAKKQYKSTTGSLSSRFRKKGRLICIYYKQHLQRRGAFWVLGGERERERCEVCVCPREEAFTGCSVETQVYPSQGIH